MDDPRAIAERRLGEALAASAMADPRLLYRDRLRQLRNTDPPAFARALEYFENTLVPAVAGDADPLTAWLAYGTFLAELPGRGRTVAVDAGGRARPYQPPPDGCLILFLPEDGRRNVEVLLGPAERSPAQQATVDLLVSGRREL